MNKGIYRLVWNSSQGALQVVSEAAKLKSCGGTGVRLSGVRSKTVVWPLALLSLGMASSAWAIPSFNVTTGADSGTGSLREQLTSTGSLFVNPGVSTITLSSDVSAFSGGTTLHATAPLTITGAGLAGNGSFLSLNGTNAGTVTTAISGQFTGSPSVAGSGINGLAGGAGANVSSGVAGVGGTGSTGKYSAAGASASSAVSGNYFAITNNATLTGGAGVSAVSTGAGGAGGSGGNNSSNTYWNSGGTGGNGGAGANGGTGAAGGAGVSGSFFAVTNNASIFGGNGSAGVGGGAGGVGGAGSNSGKYGGSGGRGGNGGNGGTGGAGGAGITGSDIQVTNTGTIQGGNGGVAGIAGAGGAGGAAGVGDRYGQVGGAGTSGIDGSAGVGGVGVVVTGRSTIYNAGTISGGFAKNGAGSRANAIELSGGSNKLILAAGSVINGNVVSSSDGGDVLALGGNSNSSATTLDLGTVGALGGSMQYQGFGSFAKDGSSTWTLTGTDTYGKNWSVNAGTLALADSASLQGAVAVVNGAKLNAGNASIAGGLNNAGTLAIGSTATPYATLSVGNDFNQVSSGTIRVSALSSSQYSKLSVNGNVHLDGTLDVDVKSGNTLATGNQLTSVISATGTVTGQFNHVTDNSLLFDFTPNYHTSSVDLDLIAAASNGGASIGGTSNRGANSFRGSVQALGNSAARGAAAALDRIIGSDPNGKLATHFVALSTQAEVSQAVTETLPLMTGGSTAAAKTALSSINGVVQARSESVRGGLSSGDSVLMDQHLWIQPFGSWADQDRSGGVAGFSSSVGGMAFGLDTSVNDRWMLGTAFVYAKADTHNNGESARQQLGTDVYQLVGYGTYHLDDTTNLNFQFDGGQNHNDGKRDLDFAGLQAKSNYDSWTAHAGVSLDRTFSLTPTTRFTPSVRADYTWIKDEAYNEKGADELSLQVKSRSTDQFILGVDGKLAHDFTQQVTLSGKLGVGYDFLASRDSLTSSFAGEPGTAFNTFASSPQRWLVRGGTELNYKVNGRLQLAVRYDVEERTDFLNQTASAEARWAF
ncbi:autotransporter domain-containing protein [Pseudomonas sp. Ma2-10]